MRQKLQIALALILCVMAPGSTVGAQSAGEPESGVWWQFQTSGGGLPAPPVLVDLPDGGLWISSSPSGDQAVSAVRYKVRSGEVAESVTLRVRQDSSTPALAVALCPPKSAWSPPETRPGPWDDRAVPDCERRAFKGALSDDGVTVTFPLTGYGAGETVDLVLTRVPDDAQSYLSATFEKPLSGDLRTGAPVSTGGGFAPASDFSGSSTVSDPVADSFAAGGRSTAGFGGSPLPAAPAADDPSADTPAEGDGATDDSDEGESAVGVPIAANSGWETSQKIAFGALALLLLAMAWILSKRLAVGASGPRVTLYKGAPPQ